MVLFQFFKMYVEYKKLEQTHKADGYHEYDTCYLYNSVGRRLNWTRSPISPMLIYKSNLWAGLIH